MSNIVITGLGATTPLGGDVASTWKALVAGTSGVTRIEEEWADGLPCQIAARAAVDPTTKVDRIRARRLDRASMMALIAAEEAWLDAGFSLAEGTDVDPDRLSVVMGTGMGGLHSLINSWDTQKGKGYRRVSPFTIPMLMANAPAANVGLLLHAKGGVHTPVSACASSNEAISNGLDILRLGRADVVVVGGTEAVIHAFPLAAFGQMQALSRRNDEPERASRPWDVDRDGFVMGEGAAVLVMETLEHAQARGARIYGRLAGAGVSADGHDMVQPDPTGEGQAKAMVKAVRDAGLQPSDIIHVNCHATSTPQGDTTEAHSMRAALGDHTAAIATGTKSMTGHLLGGAGALETMATLLALYNRVVPPTINLDNPEPDLGIDIAANTARALPAGDLAALNNSFGFGGHNVAVAVTNEFATH
ncbi:beta-ketoacyl-[acyl-carrier-protein] synthase family protein [Propionicicella superfundia]|uniref:beta-ketoacyl-[acyl-carrier-protein] synthase family protein n=1 Tax=Propionicicella superfundia TaxID=348582 RepID=UPI00041F0D4E|nr:beta-ketoacyl-[acyl-carrier-protein] synthase family protein [Propionicicella superfundia]